MKEKAIIWTLIIAAAILVFSVITCRRGDATFITRNWGLDAAVADYLIVEQPYERISITGETANKGCFDPTVEYNSDGTVGYLIYSGLEQPLKNVNNPYVKYIHTHLAKTINNGQTWTFLKRLMESEEATMPGTASLESVGLNAESYEGVWHHEVPTLAYDPDDPGKEWKFFWMKYFSIPNPRGRARIRVPEYVWIMYKYASKPEDLDSAEEIALFSTNIALPKAKYDLNKDFGFHGFTFYSEPGSLYQDGVLYVTLSGANHHKWETHKTFLLASKDHGKTWEFVNTLTNRKDAEDLGFTLLTASSLASENNRVFLLSTPVKKARSREGTHLGTFVFEFESITLGTLKRNEQNKLIPTKYLKRSLPGEFNSGEGTYHKYNTAGGIIVPQADLSSAPKLGQLFSTKERIVDEME
jgi:hypothetical protein